MEPKLLLIHEEDQQLINLVELQNLFSAFDWDTI